MNIENLYKIYTSFPFICTDSRNTTNNSLFFALKGDKFNGNHYASEAIKNGCKFAIIDEKKYNSENCILVDNVLETLQLLAKYHRKQLDIPVIGITGTNGKTTTKELIHSVLSSNYNVYATKGNLNSQIGLPLSVLEINKYHEIAILEMGANKIGEIKNLCEILNPTEGIITNIGMAHLEGFGDIRGVIKAKTELYTFINQNQGTLFINANDKLLIEKSKDANSITYGDGESSSYQASIKNQFPFVSIKIKDLTINSNLVGNFQYDNILAACCIGDYFNVSLDLIKSGIEKYIPKNNRTEIVETKDNYIILDAYNANPSSMNLMIESFHQLQKKNKLCILGDMKELGDYTSKEHNKVVKKVNSYKIESIYIGSEFCKVTSENAFLNTSDFLKQIERYNLTDKTILIKGSRGIQLELLVKNL